MLPLNNNHLLPIYVQVKNLLIQKIQNGEFNVGDQLPSERELSTKYDVSRMTARKSVTEIVNEGYAYRKKGKGTYVVCQKLKRDLIKLSSFSTLLKEKGVTNFTNKVIDKRIIEADSKLSEVLEITIGSLVYLIIRVRYGNGKPMALEYSYIPKELFPRLLEYDFSTTSLFETIENKYQNKLKLAKQQMELGYASKYHSKLLEIDESDALFIMESVTFNSNNIAIEFCKSYTRGDTCIFYSELHKK